MILGYKLVDCLTGHSKLWRHLERGNRPADPGDAARAELAVLLRQAEKFDFGALPLEPDGKGWHVPGLTEAEQEAWRMGLLPLPAPVVWYEYVLGVSRTGILVQDVGGDWLVRYVDFTPEEGVYSFTNIVVRIQRAALDEEPFALEAGKAFFRWMAERARKDAPPDSGERAAYVLLEHGVKPMPGIALYLTLMLLSRTTEVAKEPLTEAQARTNREAGRAKYAPHTVVTIVPRKYVDRGEGARGTHASPRLHWRRSHLRHYDHRTPGSVWAPEREHMGRKGWWVAVIPRFLVGVRELGEVSHEYFVRAQP